MNSFVKGGNYLKSTLYQKIKVLVTINIFTIVGWMSQYLFGVSFIRVNLNVCPDPFQFVYVISILHSPNENSHQFYTVPFI